MIDACTDDGHWANPQLFTFKHIFVTTVLYILVTVSLVLIPRNRMPGPKNCMVFFPNHISPVLLAV